MTKEEKLWDIKHRMATLSEDHYDPEDNTTEKEKLLIEALNILSDNNKYTTVVEKILFWGEEVEVY